MNCLQAEKHFSAYFEDTLDYQALRDFEAHLTGCEACQHEYARFQESVEAVQQLPPIEPSPNFTPKLMQRLAEEPHEFGGITEIIATSWHRLQAGLRSPKWAFSGTVALILIVAVGGYFYQAGFLSDRDSQPAVVVTPASEPSRLGPPPVELPVDVQRQVSSINSFSPGGVIRTSQQPMQQHYVLKQVSYTSASTGGGL
ncbi:MAG: zf-HC2 domain-containing protein [Candidatus Poribacteria bacterium]|nr:zf-HC2 domain-containing protein [Candidatus Poribacteria bacterium]